VLDTVGSLAEFLSCSTQLLRKFSREDNFPIIRLGRAVRFDRGEVLAWLRARSTAPENEVRP
jgi:predicted DNA-binding transcriptional regulator AlpA